MFLTSLGMVELSSLRPLPFPEPNRLVLPMVELGMAAGRAFLPQDDAPSAGRVATLSHSPWERRFGADPRLVGRAVVIGGDPYVVVGILAIL